MTLGVAVVGLGVGARHLERYAADPRCRVVAVCDHDRVKAEGAAAPHGAWVTTDAAAAIARDGVDAVSIASHDADHAAQVRLALSLGRRVMVEKPLCTTMDDLHAIGDAVGAADAPVLASNLVLRAAPMVRNLLGMVRDGALGEVYAVDGEYLYGRLEKLTLGWRGVDPAYSPFLGGAVHLVDLMLLVTGTPPDRVVAAGGDVCARGSRYTGHDHIAATFTFPGGAVGRVTANFGSVTRHHHVLRVYGTRGTFISDDAGARLHTARDPGAPVRGLDWAVTPPDKGALIPSFVDACHGLPTTLPGAAHELSVVGACCAADLSRVSGEWVQVPAPKRSSFP